MQFSPEERAIYRYRDGVSDGEVCADPIVVFRRLFHSSQQVQDFATTYREAHARTDDLQNGVPPEVQLAAQQSLLFLAREAFEVQPLDKSGKGLTERETMDLLYDFLRWSDEKKAPTETGPKSSERTDSPAAPAA